MAGRLRSFSRNDASYWRDSASICAVMVCTMSVDASEVGMRVMLTHSIAHDQYHYYPLNCDGQRPPIALVHVLDLDAFVQQLQLGEVHLACGEVPSVFRLSTTPKNDHPHVNCK